ncbi:hypothetical protein HPB47_016288 [Ixodes persulcatus]|uniref:Uncharacterized protein n=1 Tax=Ixodes persulcatus TaxID=34615 RepID=A0AC60QUY0_IXOPE|nr:hypothetical protein HPB47_016288 [Ixodes persulcatus]
MPPRRSNTHSFRRSRSRSRSPLRPQFNPRGHSRRARRHNRRQQLPRTAEAATWCVMEAGRMVTFASRMAWEHQPQVPQGTAPEDVPHPFRRRTMTERCAADLPAAYDDEEYAAICELCRVPLISCEQQHQEALHHDREDRQRALVRAGSRALTPADIEAALLIVGRACPEHPRPTLTLSPELANKPSSNSGATIDHSEDEGRPPPITKASPTAPHRRVVTKKARLSWPPWHHLQRHCFQRNPIVD